MHQAPAFIIVGFFSHENSHGMLEEIRRITGGLDDSSCT